MAHVAHRSLALSQKDLNETKNTEAVILPMMYVRDQSGGRLVRSLSG